MQEWFDELKANYPYMANEIFDKGFNKYLEKEKEQMIDFGKKMQLVQHVSYDDDITYCFEPEKYYNQTYNQNK